MRSLLSALALCAPLIAQDVLPTPEPTVIPGSYIVQFKTRSFDLSRFKNAIYARSSVDEVASIVADMEESVRRDQAGFVARIIGMGGTVSHQWWIINGAAVEGIAGDGLAALSALPGVARVEQTRIHYPTNNTARNSTHHEADQANQRRNAANELVRGQGLSVAILDTGVDALFGSTGAPHPAYYPGGNQNNRTGGGIAGSRLMAVFGTGSDRSTEDLHGHGSHVSGSSGSDFSSYRGIAPGTGIVGIKITAGNSGGASSTALVAAWQTVATQRLRHNIAVANNSFSGSPSLTSAIQVALDNTALNADVLACCSAGNSGTNTRNSPNTWNGLAVGSLNKNSLAVSSFSGRGPLDNFGRTYPDITTVGASVTSIRPNTTSGGRSSGTSMASPMAAGGGALVRCVHPRMTAIEAKALLLNYTKHTQNSRNQYGLGMMDCDAAVQAAIAGDYHTIRLTGNTFRRSFRASTTGSMALTAVWMHPGGSRFDNINMRVLNSSNTVVAQDNNTLNSYESVDFNVQGGQTYTVELTRVGTAVISNLDIAIAGLADIPTTRPTISSISPASVVNTAGTTITLTGQFDRIDHVDVGGTRITNFTIASPTQLTFSLPSPAEIGSFPVSVTNSIATSNSVNLAVQGTHPLRIKGPALWTRNLTLNLTATGDRSWRSIMLVSLSNQPSNLPSVVSLGIGANFTQLFQLTTMTHDTKGAATHSLFIPAAAPAGAYHFQAITFDPNNLVTPLEVSNVQSVAVF